MWIKHEIFKKNRWRRNEIFRNLRKGDYTIYVYSKDTIGLNQVENNKMPIVIEVTIDDKKQEIDLGEIVVYDEI